MQERNDQPIGAGERGVEQTLGRAAVLLDALAGAQASGLRFTDLMHETGFSKATLHRLLTGLAAHGFIETEQPGGRYFLGFQLGAWAAAARNRFGLADRVQPVVRELSERVGDTAYLSVRADEMAVCLVLQEGAAAIRALPLAPGDRSALGVGSASAAILAFIADEREIDRILAAPAHIAYCARRSVSEEHIRRHIARTRKRGYSFVDDLNPHMIGMALPILNAAGQPVAAVSVATIHARLQNTKRRETALEELRKTVSQLQPLLRQCRLV